MPEHASTRERAPHLDGFYAPIWEVTGTPASVLDLGCGLNPLALPWMGIGDAMYHAIDVDAGTLDVARGFLAAVGQPHIARSAISSPMSRPSRPTSPSSSSW
jgi:16S rRNA (guanine(1405)-N(7))-methyltransferase